MRGLLITMFLLLAAPALAGEPCERVAREDPSNEVIQMGDFEYVLFRKHGALAPSVKMTFRFENKSKLKVLAFGGDLVLIHGESLVLSDPGYELQVTLEPGKWVEVEVIADENPFLESDLDPIERLGDLWPKPVVSQLLNTVYVAEQCETNK